MIARIARRWAGRPGRARTVVRCGHAPRQPGPGRVWETPVRGTNSDLPPPRFRRTVEAVTATGPRSANSSAPRRARITPEQAGLPAYGGNRRVKGLRREEVAMLAGVSIDYYVRMERGNLSAALGVRARRPVRALQLDEAERDHLFLLARAAGAPVRAVAVRRRPACARRSSRYSTPSPTRRRGYATPGTTSWPPTAWPRAVFARLRRSAPAGEHARFVYLDPAARDFFVDWDRRQRRRRDARARSGPQPP